eukprot:m.33831 g.33831  ORF g.33831 m.33831 type:complete len:546 (+) comp5145_c1_seq1:34-1671(+)
MTSLKLDALRQRESLGAVDGAGGAAHVLLPRVAAGLAAAAGLLLAAEGTADLSTGRGNVHVDDATVRAEGAGPLEDALQVLGEEAAGQALARLVVDRDGLVEALALHDIEDGHEGLLQHDLGVVLDGDDRRLHKVARAGDGLAAGEDLTALGDCALDGGLVVLDGRLGVQRAAQDAGMQGVADLDLLVRRKQTRRHLVVHRLVQDQAAGGGAALAGGADGSEEHGTDGHVNVRVVHDNDCVVAAQLEERLAEAALDGDGDLAADARAAREADQVDLRVLGHLLADLSTATDGGTDGAGQVVRLEDLADDVGDSDGAQRRRWGPLPQVHVAANKADGVVPAKDSNREVEGGDDADQPEGIPVLQQVVAGALGRDDLARERAGQADSEVADVDILLHFALALSQNLAHLQRDQLAERLLLLAERVADLADNLATLGSRDLRPDLVRLARCSDRRSVVLCGALAHGGDDIARAGIDGLHDLAARSPLAVVDTVVLLLEAQLLQERIVVVAHGGACACQGAGKLGKGKSVSLQPRKELSAGQQGHPKTN